MQNHLSPDPTNWPMQAAVVKATATTAADHRDAATIRRACQACWLITGERS